MKETRYGVYGVGGCGRGVMPLVRAQLQKATLKGNELVFIDDGQTPSKLNSHHVVSYEKFISDSNVDRFAVIAIADSRVRQRISRCFVDDGVIPLTVMAENVVVMDDVVLGEGSILSPFVTITSNVRIGKHFHANLYSYVEHDCVIGDYVTFAPGVKCNGNIRIHDHAYIGAGAVIKQGCANHPLVIGRGAVVGMGAVVTRDVPSGVTVVGNPARQITKRRTC